MVVPFAITIEDDSLMTLSKRGFDRVMKATYYAVGEYWDRHFVAPHFKLGNRQKYGYEPRSAKYERKKKAMARSGFVKKQGRVDLVFTGATERTVVRHHPTHAYPTRATVNVAAPSYIMSRTRTRRALKQEILTVAESESETLGNIALAAQAKALEAEQQVRTSRRIR